MPVEVEEMSTGVPTHPVPPAAKKRAADKRALVENGTLSPEWYFEPQMTTSPENGWVPEVGIYQGKLPNKGRFHLGYMKKFFRTREDACEYYDRCNPHMRPLNAHGTYRSDWDPETHLFYIVRANHCFNARMEPFDETLLERTMKKRIKNGRGGYVRLD